MKIDLELYTSHLQDEIDGLRKHNWLAVLPKILAELKAARKVVDAARKVKCYAGTDCLGVFSDLENALEEMDGEK